MDSSDDLVERNRAANPRRTPDREPLGNHLIGRLYVVAAVVLVVATTVLIAVLAS